jgi:arabinose-5-phosphate isomerase
MTGGPVTINASALAAEAVRLMEERRISVLLVSDDRARLTGALHLHDLLQAKVV